jgi:hypothetical protein
MADFSLPGLLEPFANIATASSAGEWISLGIYFIVSIIASGIILAILLKILGSVWGEEYDLGRAFIIALIISVINFFGMGLIGPYISFLPPQIFPAIIWIVLIKLFIGAISWPRAIIAGAIGFVLSIVVAPMISGLIVGILSSVLPI